MAIDGHKEIVEIVSDVADATLLGAPRFAGFALPWLMSLNAGQQFFFQRSPQLPKPLSLHLETIEELDDLTVIVTKRVEACVSRH